MGIWTSIGYATQPAESGLMKRNPRHPKLEPLISKGMLAYSYLYIGVLQFFFCSMVYFVYLGELLPAIGHHMNSDGVSFVTNAEIQHTQQDPHNVDLHAFNPHIHTTWEQFMSKAADRDSYNVVERHIYEKITTVYYWSLV